MAALSPLMSEPKNPKHPWENPKTTKNKSENLVGPPPPFLFGGGVGGATKFLFVLFCLVFVKLILSFFFSRRFLDFP
jgi:hypothetical protein